jgi:hypothetical protein
MKEMTISISRSAGWRVVWVVLATTIRAYLDGSAHIQFSISEEVNR